MSRQVDLGQIIPNIQVGTTTTGLPSSQASVVNVGTDLNPILNFTIPKGEPGAIQMIIVNELPQTGQENTIYLVPLAIPESQENRYAEYVYINGNWELLGKIGIQVDLSDYYTKQETNNLLDNKADVSDIPDLTDYVKNTDYATASKGGVIKIGTAYGTEINNAGILYPTLVPYNNYANMSNYAFIGKGTLENVLNARIGDINTVLDSINGEEV